MPRFIQSGEKSLGEAGECVRGFLMNGLHCAFDLVASPPASIQVRMDQPARYETFLIDFNQYVEHRAGQRLGDGVLIAIEPLGSIQVPSGASRKPATSAMMAKFDASRICSVSE